MLIEFSVSNFRSFNEEQTLSLVAGRDRKHPENLIAKSGLRLLKAAAIYGANASGKSSLIKALDVLVDAVRLSATRLTEGDRIPGIVPFRLNSQTPEKPSRFAVKFLKEGDLYEYSLAATSRRVHEESLSRSCIGKKPEVWFTRRFQHQTQSHEWSFSGPLKEDERAVLRDRTRDNGLALSRGAEQNIKPLSDVFSAFTQFWVFDLSSSPQHLLQVTARRMIQNDVFARRILALVRDADFDIKDLSVKEVPLDGKKLSLVRRILSAPELKDLKDLNEKELLETDIRASHLVREDRKSTRLNSSHLRRSRMPSSA
jgi:predicted ATP-dependent endonuclease of OLD family